MTFTTKQIDTVTQHYLIACEWADKPEGTQPRITEASRHVARVFCEDFIHLAEREGQLFTRAMACDDYGWYQGTRNPEEAFGHDLWLTCAGHGAGFWDRDALDADGLGDSLTELCKPEALDIPDVDFYRGWLHLTRWDGVRAEHYPSKPLKVCFRKFLGEHGGIIALLNDTGKDCRPGNIMSYMHVGQHAEVPRQWYGDKMPLATPDEYASLARELRGIYRTTIQPVKRMVA